MSEQAEQEKAKPIGNGELLRIASAASKVIGEEINKAIADGFLVTYSDMDRLLMALVATGATSIGTHVLAPQDRVFD